MRIDAPDLVSAYVNWLKSKIKVNKLDDILEISTPFLDRHNDKLQIYVRTKNNRLILTDDGYTINDLTTSGCDLTTDRRQKQIKIILNGFGIHLVDDELTTEATMQNFPQKKHALIQAMLTINDMFLTTSGRVANFFLEDVAAYFNLHDIRFMTAIHIIGKSGFSHRFDFAIPPSRKKPERLIRAINNPVKDKTMDVLFSWTDVLDTRTQETMMYVILNDSKPVNAEIISAFKEYGVHPIEWSQRDYYRDELAS